MNKITQFNKSNLSSSRCFVLIEFFIMYLVKFLIYFEICNDYAIAIAHIYYKRFTIKFNNLENKLNNIKNIYNIRNNQNYF